MSEQSAARAKWHRWAEDRAERERAALADGTPPVGNAWRHVPGARAARPGDEMIGGYTFDQWRALMAWGYHSRGQAAPWETTSPEPRPRATTRYGTR